MSDAPPANPTPPVAPLIDAPGVAPIPVPIAVPAAAAPVPELDTATFKLDDGTTHACSARMLRERCPALYDAWHGDRRTEFGAVDGVAMAVLLDWLASGGERNCTDASNVVRVMAVAHRFGVGALAQACLGAMASTLAPETAVSHFAESRRLGLDPPAAIALGFISRNTTAVLASTPDDVVSRLSPDAVRELLGMRWVAASEDALFMFANRWCELLPASAARPDEAAIASVLAAVDLYRLSGPFLTTVAKPLANAEPGRYVHLLESLLLRDSRPCPPPFRFHGFFAVAPLHGAFPGYRRIAAAEFPRLVRGVAEQIAMEGGALPMLGLFDMADASVVVADSVPMSSDGPQAAAIRIKGVTLTIPGEHPESRPTRAVGWARLSWANKTDPTTWPGISSSAAAQAFPWSFEPLPTDKKGDWPCLFALEWVS